jgi:hypothetical protein
MYTNICNRLWQCILGFSLITRLYFFLCNEHACPARSGKESCYLDRHIALGVATADLSMIGPRRFDNRRIEVLRSKL